jgi:hypothetical protein
MLTLTDTAVARLLDQRFGITAYTPPVTDYLLLTIGGVEVSGGSYARKALTNNTTNYANTASRVKALQVAQSFAQATLDWGAVDGIGIADDPTAGTTWLSGPLGDLPVLGLGSASTDVITSTAHGFSTGQTVRVEAPAGASLPTGLAASTNYYVRDVTANTFKLSASLSGGVPGAAIDLTADGAAWVMAWYGKTVSAGDIFTVPANALKIKLTTGS